MVRHDSITVGAISVTNESGSTIDVEAIARLASFLRDRLRLHSKCELSIMAVDAARMEQLHLDWMDEPGPTDVLSFPMDEVRPTPEGQQPVVGVLGDIVLCPSFAASQAVDRGRTLDQELQFLVTHGLLHLLGHDHATESEYEAMFALQDELLGEWAVACQEGSQGR